MEKNTILAVILSFIVILLWYRFFLPKVVPPTPVEVKTVPREVTVSSEEGKISLPKKQVVQAVEEITLDTAGQRIIFTSAGAAVKQWTLKEKNNGVDLVLSSEGQYLFLSTLPELNYRVLNRDKNITFQSTTSEGIVITKRYEFSEDTNYHRLIIELDNHTGQDNKIDNFLLTLGPGLDTDEKDKRENLRILRALLYRNKEVEKVKPGEYKNTDWLWAGIDNRYFLVALVPENKFDFLRMEKVGKDKLPLLSFGRNLTLPANTKVTLVHNFYLGPKKYVDLKKYKLGLEKSVNFGFFAPLSQGALYSLNWLYSLTRNYGWAIVILTLFLQILLFPLTRKSFQASISLKKLQPMIDQVKLKYKNDPKRFQAELFALYKNQKVNPFGGCLPMILQIPVFWALFTTLHSTYELRSAPFILWISDLSRPDALFRIGSISINILPLLMGLLMLYQQKLTTVTADPQQAKMMYLMPVVFTFIFWNFPSGLVLYWLTSSLFSTLGQFYLMKRA